MNYGTLPDVATLSRNELEKLLMQLRSIAKKRRADRIVLGAIDVVRAELAERQGPGFAGRSAKSS